jgi:azurin
VNSDFFNERLRFSENWPVFRRIQKVSIQTYIMKKFITALLSAALCQFAIAQETKIEITGNDQMQYNIKAFEVTEGQKVVLSFKHIGQLPAAAMGHNVVILKAGTAVPAFSAKCATAKDNQYIPTDDESKKLMVAHTKMLGGGESDQVTFTAPAAGSYPFICTFPGHFAIMQGVMTVKAK